MKLALPVLALSIGLLILANGCMPPIVDTVITVDPNTTDPNTADPNDTPDPNTGQNPPSLSAEDEALAQMLARKQTWLMSALGAIGYIARPGVLPATDGVFQTGTCPAILGERLGNALAIQLNYGTGCSVTQYAPGTFSGVITIIIDMSTGAITATYDTFTANGESLAGFIAPATVTFDDGTATLVGSITFDDADTNASAEFGILGTIAATLDSAAGTITISQGDLELTEDVDPVPVALNDVVSNSQQNGNFTPQGGTVTASSLTVTFDQASPAQGTASASVNGAAGISFDLE